MDERLTKKERKEQRKLEELARMEHDAKTKSSSRTKWIVVVAAAVLFLAFFGYSIFASKAAHDKQTAAPAIKFANTGWATGNIQSKTTVTEFGDFECSACRAFEPTFDQARKDYGSKVKFVFKHFPLKSVHPNAMIGAVAAEAAGKQGKFWEYHDTLYANQDNWAQQSDPTDQLVSYAKKLNLDVSQFTTDLKSHDFDKIINDQEDEGIKDGVNGTPTVYINGKYLGFPDYTTLKQAIDKELSLKK